MAAWLRMGDVAEDMVGIKMGWVGVENGRSCKGGERGRETERERWEWERKKKRKRKERRERDGMKEDCPK